ncbi:MAG: type II secretion system protein [Firmicutes bacterium]|nr:type II secretion system protein [Bacillota bacterium]
MRKEKGFTLIELLAVIVILGLLLTIAVPAVSSYITSSKKGSFISSAKLFLNQARNQSLIDRNFPRDENEKVTIPISDLDMEKDMQKSSYGNSWVDRKSYIIIENIGTSENPKYSYSIALEDEKGFCINLTLGNDLNPAVVLKNKCLIEENSDSENENVENIKINAVQKILTIASNNSTLFQVDTDGNIHYYGSTPKNYVTFNGEEAGWRILGIYNVDGEKRGKLVKSTSIGAYSRDNKNVSTGAANTLGSNDWTDARLMKLLNPGYEKETVGVSLYWNGGSGRCYAGQNNATISCSFIDNGLKEEAKSLIIKSTFNISGHTSDSIVAPEMYVKEKSKTWQGYVGLMTASDYEYASNLTNCKKTLGQYLSDKTNCCETNYLVNNNYDEWLLSYNPNATHFSFLRYSNGRVAYHYPYYIKEIRPAVYLKSSVQIVGNGDGSSSAPFELSL